MIFPTEDYKPWLVSLGVGTLGFKNDFDLVKLPGVRRSFSMLVSENGFCKVDFTDLETSLPKTFTKNILHLKGVIKNYAKYLPTCEIVSDPQGDKGQTTIDAFLARYAKLRDWPSNQNHRKAIDDALSKIPGTSGVNDSEEVLNLVKTRRFVILQGAPGTGKTRLAKEIAQKIGAKKTYFTQFHAETNYGDFIYGIRPNLKSENVTFVEHFGPFYNSLKHALDNPKETIVLIIDEINRANLSNILGPIFYLFEYGLDDDSVEVSIGGDLSVKKIPENYFVIGTMNTADRSLAVVDFALRRRFAWYTLKPKIIDPDPVGKKFFKKDFEKFNQIFQMYAQSDELSLQPGHAYFLAKDDKEMKNRIKFELLPLILEYLAENRLRSAKEEFYKYFRDRLGEEPFE